MPAATPDQSPHDCLQPDHFEERVADLARAIEDLSSQQKTAAAHIEEAVVAGIRRAVADSATWEAASLAIRAQAQSAAGGLLLGGMRAAITRLAWIVAIVASLYALGGLPAVIGWLKAGGANH